MGTDRPRLSVSGNQISTRPVTGTRKTKLSSSFSLRRTSSFSSFGSFILLPSSLSSASTDMIRIGRRDLSLVLGIRKSAGASSCVSAKSESLFRVSFSSGGITTFGAIRYLPRTTIRNQHSMCACVPVKRPKSQKVGGIQTRSSSRVALCKGDNCCLPTFPKCAPERNGVYWGK